MPKLIAGKGLLNLDTSGLIDVCGADDGLSKLSLQIAVVTGGAGLCGNTESDLDDRELLLVPLDGTAVVTIEREDDATAVCCAISRLEAMGLPTAVVYMPPGATWSISATTGLARLALITCLVSQNGQTVKASPAVVTPETMKITTVGRDNWRREVRTFTAGVPAARLIAGETVHLVPGGWSSFPPHKHDTWTEAGERPLEEFYFYRCQPDSGFGVQLVYGHGVDFAERVTEGDCVIIDRGYHPVAATPGTIMYYLWALAGKTTELGITVDPDFSECHL